MSKYYKLGDNDFHRSNAVDDAEFALIFDADHHNEENSNYNNNKNHNNDSNRAPNATIDVDDHAMDVPLLNNAITNNTEFESTKCRCNQRGFGANLLNKSTKDAKYKILFAISLCCIFMIIEFLGGYLAGSLAIMTDAAHLASDCITFVIGLTAIWLGTKAPDNKMSFGYKRLEVIGALISILSIWILTASLVMMAIERIISNDYELNANVMMTISGIGILINVVMFFILHGSLFGDTGHGHGHGHSHAHTHAHALNEHNHRDGRLANGNATPMIGNGLKSTANGNISTHEKNVNLRAAIIHVIGDLVQSIGVFLASILIKFYPSAKFADPLCTLLFSVIVICTTLRLFKESMNVIMDAVPAKLSLHELEMDLNHIEGVKFVHHLNVWNHTTNYSVMMVHLIVDLLADSNTVLDTAIQLASSAKYNIKHSTIQIERVTS